MINVRCVNFKDIGIRGACGTGAKFGNALLILLVVLTCKLP